MPLIDRDDCALVIIDVQTDFYPPHRLDVDRQRFHDMVRRIAWITSVADRLEIPVVVTEEDPAASGHTVPEIREVLPAKAVTLPKNAFAVWDNPDIAAAVEATGRTTMILAGIETDICVAHSAIRMHHAGKRVVVVDDAAYSPGQAHEREPAAPGGPGHRDALHQGTLLRLGAHHPGRRRLPRHPRGPDAPAGRPALTRSVDGGGAARPPVPLPPPFCVRPGSSRRSCSIAANRADGSWRSISPTSATRRIR